MRYILGLIKYIRIVNFFFMFKMVVYKIKLCGYIVLKLGVLLSFFLLFEGDKVCVDILFLYV